jgi:hypothetical protein
MLLQLINTNMKKIFYTLGVVALLATFSNSSYAQIRKIPAEVTSSLTEKYPSATNVEWRDKLTGFTATFTLDSNSYTATFNNKGEWERTEQEIDKDELPEAIEEGFNKSKYADWNISQVSKIDLPDNQVQYKIEVSKGDIKKRNLYFSSKGRLLKDLLTL